MEIKQVIAIIDRMALEDVEAALLDAGIPGVTVSRVKGYGEHKNFYTRDWMEPHVRVEAFAEATKADAAVEAIVGAAHSGEPGDGFVAVLPVERVCRVRDRREAVTGEV